MHRRILSLWFPRLAAERWLRRIGGALPEAFAVVGDVGGAQVLVSLNAEAMAAGLRAGQPLRDATAMCPQLLTRPADPVGEAMFLTALRRWAGKFSPWVAEEPPDALVVDLTGCAHLFGGEEGLMAEAEADCLHLGLTLRAGIADTPGAAWALARFAGRGEPSPLRSGDDIAQEARATRSRAVKRRGWERGGPALPVPPVTLPQGVIAAPGHTRQALSPLPVAALRLPPARVEALARLGLRQVADVLALPRAGLARRFGADTLRQIDRALGLEPEPVSPAAAPLHFATRMRFPEPIGLAGDIAAGIDRLLDPLCARLRDKGRGARRVRLQVQRADGTAQSVEVGLAQAADRPDRIRPLLALKIETIDPGFGIDGLRLEAVETEPVHALQHRGHLEAMADAMARQEGARPDGGPAGGAARLADLIGRLGARLGSDSVMRAHPADSHIPEKGALVLSAAWSEPWAGPWPPTSPPRPLVLMQPEPVFAPETPTPPARFRWRRREHETRTALGPERLAPEWWLDDPGWRSGVRDYWRIETATGERFWLFFAHGGAVSGGWFAHGIFG